MRIHDRRGTFKSSARFISPKMVILHHTAGHFKTAVPYLKQKGYGYHYIIDRNGDIYNFVDPDLVTSHAYARNTGTIGVCFEAGHPLGPVTSDQIEACIALLKDLKTRYSSLESVSGHKHQDPRSSRGKYNKIDPTFAGEPPLSVDWDVDRKNMDYIASQTGLLFASSEHLLSPSRK